MRVFLSCLIVLGSTVANAQNYPQKSIRMLAPEAGGGGDFSARLIAPGLSARLGQQVLVDNRGAASGIIAGQLVKNATPDGHTLLFYGSAIWLLQYMQDNVPFHPLRDFVPITVAAMAPSILVVHPSVPVASVNELIALAKAKPATLNYASGAAAGASHLGPALFMSMTGVNLVRVNFKGTSPALNAVLAGEAHLMFPTTPLVAPHLKTGKLKALAITSLTPSALAPGLPTVAASLPGFEAGQKYAMFAPAKTPATIINRLHQEVVRVVNQEDVKTKFLNVGTDVVGNSPQQFVTMLKGEMASMGKILKDSGVTSN